MQRARGADFSPQPPSSPIKGLCSSRTPRLSSYTEMAGEHRGDSGKMPATKPGYARSILGSLKENGEI